MAKQTAVVAAPQEEKALPITIGTISSVLPKPVALNTASVAAEIVRYHKAADDALDQAAVAEINSEESLGKGADVVKSISAMIKDADDTRKSHTKLYDDAKTTVKELFDATILRLTEAKTALTGKMSVWQIAEQKRRQKEAAEKQQAAQVEAARLAKVQSALGDKAGAAAIVEAAANVSFAPEKVRTVGGYGAAVGTRTKRFGVIVHKTVFLNALLKRREQPIKDALEELTVPQHVLDSLARDILDGKLGAIPGFEAKKDEKLDVR